jgi:hypothetical protein
MQHGTSRRENIRGYNATPHSSVYGIFQSKGLCTTPAGFIPSGPENVLGQSGPFADLFFHQGGVVRVVGVVGRRTPKRGRGHASRPFAEN